MTISFTDYCLNAIKKKYDFTFKITNGVGVFVVDGKELSKAELDILYPTPDVIHYSDNCDKRKLWMHDHKSY